MSRLRAWLLVCAVALLGAVAAPARAQIVGEGGEIQISAPWFGVGGAVRAGDWTGIRLAIEDSAERQREVLLRISLTDADGDRVLYEANVTTNPGVAQQQWMYVNLPPRFRASDVLQVQAFAAVEQASPDPTEPARFVAGRLLATTRLQAREAGLIARTEGLIGVVGARTMGLSRYMGLPGAVGLPGAHERSMVVTWRDADAMPDRWMGLASYDVVVWNDPPPGSLGTARAQALRDWVMRGGHLVVVLPRTGQSWTDEVNNPLFDITPRVRVERRESVDLEPLRALVTTDARVVMPKAETLQVFTPAGGASAEEAIGVLAGPDGSWIVARRLAGAGMVTLVGLDVASRWMTERGLPEPELFWHRVLGRRGELVQPKEGQGGTTVVEREPVTLDRDIPALIAKTGRAEIGVLVGLAVFVAYWLVSGPIGYLLLKRTGRTHHGWLGFVVAAAAFTGIAWGGAWAIRPKRVEASHFTIIDHVYGQPVQRARAWISLLIPRYGDAAITIGDPAQLSAAGAGSVIAPWEPEGGSAAAFPDARGYRMNSRAPQRVVVPTRSTVKQLQLDWSGGPQWKMPRPVGETADGSEAGLRFVDGPGVRSGPVRSRIRMSGVLRHELPAALSDVVIIVNRGQKDIVAGLGKGGPMLWEVAAVRLPRAWEPGEPLDLGLLDFQYEPQSEYFAKLIQSDVGQPEGLQAPDNDRTRMIARLTALGLLSQLQPPKPDGDVVRRERLAQRKLTHGFDLGAWFTQPGVIIIGHVGERDDGPGTPVPLYVGAGGPDRPAASAGRTLVRWWYPMPADPPRMGGVEVEAGDAKDQGGR